MEMGPDEVDLVINYFLDADHQFLEGMGVAPKRLPDAAEWRQLLIEDLDRQAWQKKTYYLIWVLDGAPVGHVNINKIVYGDHAFMHLHIWDPQRRREGNGTRFLNGSITRFFELFRLQRLFCEPYAFNPAPNRTLEKTGFAFIKTYETVPGWINYYQAVNRWVLTRKKWLSMLPANDCAPQSDADSSLSGW